MHGIAFDEQGQQALHKLTKRLLLLFVVPLVVVAILTVYGLYLTLRVRHVENQAMTLKALQTWNITERILSKERNYKWAISQFEKLIQDYPHPQILTRLAGLYLNDDLERADKLLRQAAAADENFWEIYSTRHVLYTLQEGKDEQAVQAARRALELNPLDAQTLNNLGWLHATTTNKMLQDLTAAEKYAQLAVQYTRGENTEYLDTLAEVQQRRGEIEKARKTILQAIRVEQRTLQNLMAKQEQLAKDTESQLHSTN